MVNQRSVSSILKSARLAKGLSLPQASRDLRIHPRFLLALEEGDYQCFSSSVHLKGFLKNYAEYLDLPVGEILAFFRREYAEEAGKIFINPTRPLGTTVAWVTPERAVASLIILLIISFFGYLFLEYRSFASAPNLLLTQPVRDFKTDEAVITVAGRTVKGVDLLINGQSINLSDDGSFEVSITLLDGVNVLSIVSKNKLGKEARVVRTVILESVAAAEAAVATPSGVATPSAIPDLASLEIRVSPESAWLEIFSLSREEILFKGLMVAGVSQNFTDSQGFKLRTGNAGSTVVIFNGRDLGKIGGVGEVVEREFR